VEVVGVVAGCFLEVVRGKGFGSYGLAQARSYPAPPHKAHPSRTRNTDHKMLSSQSDCIVARRPGNLVFRAWLKHEIGSNITCTTEKHEIVESFIQNISLVQFVPGCTCD
jgi:hypothetical protein